MTTHVVVIVEVDYDSDHFPPAAGAAAAAATATKVEDEKKEVVFHSLFIYSLLSPPTIFIFIIISIVLIHSSFLAAPFCVFLFFAVGPGFPDFDLKCRNPRFSVVEHQNSLKNCFFGQIFVPE